jgi:hypothetical protein
MLSLVFNISGGLVQYYEVDPAISKVYEYGEDSSSIMHYALWVCVNWVLWNMHQILKQIPCLLKDKSYFVLKPFWFFQKVLWIWYHHNAWVLIDNIFVMLGGRVFQQTVCNYMDTNWPLPLFELGRLHTGDSEEKRKEHCPIL